MTSVRGARGAANISLETSVGQRIRRGTAPAASLLLLAVLLGSPSAPAWAQTSLIQFGSSMRYRPNASDPGIGLTWTAEGFNDASWSTGSYGVGYETATGAQNLLLTTVPAGAFSVYTRATFTVPDVSMVQSLTLGADWDDGYVAWINGAEVYRSPEMPLGVPAWNTNSGLHESSNGQTPSYGALHDVTSTAMPALHDGVNVLAIGVWNSNAPSSSDLVLVPQLVLTEIPETLALVRGPYMQLGTPTSLVMQWRTNGLTDSLVRFGASPGALTQVRSLPQSTTEHTVALTGLQPETRYYYSVGSSSVTWEGGDAQHTFLTSPPAGAPRAKRIWVLGDAGRGNPEAQAVRDAYYSFAGALPTDLWMMLGDNAYVSGTDQEYQTGIFDIYPLTLESSVLWPTYGNHDAMSADAATQTGPYFDIFTLPSAGQAGGVSSGTEAYYSFDYANVHFICLDSAESSRLPGSPMLVWLQQDLAATQQSWIVAFWHHPPYTRGSHNSDSESDLIQMRENVLPILEARGVDLVLCGHSHSYERSFLIDGHYGLSTTFSESNKIDDGGGGPGTGGPYQKALLGPDPHKGTVYVVAGSSSAISGGTLDHPAMYKSLNMLGSLVLDLLGNRLDVRFLDSAGVVRDTFTILKGAELAPAADFFASPKAGPAPLTVDFLDRSTNSPVSWAWDFENNGTQDSTAQNPSRNYASPGLYSIKLTASNGAGSSSVTRTSLVCVTAGPVPAKVANLRIAADEQTLSWNPQPSGTVYDVVKGDLPQLAASHGDFTASLRGCLASGSALPQASDPAVPAPGGGGFYYLVRVKNCAGSAGSYDAGDPGQAGSRDGEIAASPLSCQ